jgi:hypothetical protein
MQKDMARARLGECECERECCRAACSSEVNLDFGTTLSLI